MVVTDEPNPEQRDDIRAVGTAAGLGCSIVVSIVLSIGGGVLFDRWRGTAPWGILVGVAIGLVLAGYQLYELAQLGREDVSSGPLTRQIERFTKKDSGKQVQS